MQFHETHGGHIFYQGTMPRIAERLDRIATALEKIAKSLTQNENDDVKTQVHEATSPSNQ
jgi:hypothetical protein